MSNKIEENNGVIIDENFLQQNNLDEKKRKRAKTLMILAIVFFALALIGNVFEIFLSADILVSVKTPSVEEGPIDSTGLEKGFGLIIYIVFMIPTAILMVLNLVFNFLIIKTHKVLAITLLAVSVAMFIVHIILMNAAVNYEPTVQALASIL